jgi:hypothetical protein
MNEKLRHTLIQIASVAPQHLYAHTGTSKDEAVNLYKVSGTSYAELVVRRKEKLKWRR